MFDANRSAAEIGNAIELFEERTRYSDRILFELAPHALYTVSKEALVWCADFANEHGLMIHTH